MVKVPWDEITLETQGMVTIEHIGASGIGPGRLHVLHVTDIYWPDQGFSHTSHFGSFANLRRVCFNLQANPSAVIQMCIFCNRGHHHPWKVPWDIVSKFPDSLLVPVVIGEEHIF